MFKRKKREYKELKAEDYKYAGGQKAENSSRTNRNTEDGRTDPYEIEQGEEERERFKDSQLIGENISYLSLEDYIEFSKLAISKKIKRKLIIWPLLSLLMALALVLISIHRGNFTWRVLFLALILSLFSSIMMVYFLMIMPKNTAQSYRNQDIRMMGIDGGEPYKLFRFYNDGIASRTSDGRHNTMSYDDVDKIYESENLFAFSLNSRAGYLMRKDSFKQGSADLVKEKIEQARTKKNKSK